MLITGALAAEQRTVVARSASYGSNRPQISQAPAGATENHRAKTHLFRPVRSLNRFANIVPMVVTVVYHRELLRSLKFHTHAVAAKFAAKSKTDN